MKRISLGLVYLLLISINCTQDDGVTQEVALDYEINDFVWKGLNKFYYWQDQVPNLADSKIDHFASYNDFIRGYSKPKDLFESLLFQPGQTDRFSWFIEDYVEQNASFRGVNDAFGFEFGLTIMGPGSTEVIGYITYVVPNSPATDAGIKRGDFFTEFNGTALTTSNYSIVNGYYSDNSITLSFATYQNGSFSKNGKISTLSLRQVIENPVHFKSIIEDNGKKIGYLVYNGFKFPFHAELNAVFGDFKAANIDELILDLRYNGGGVVLTSAYLASMIHGTASTTENFARLLHNSKNQNDNDIYPFYNNSFIYGQDGKFIREESINRLTSLSRVFIITSDDTASASEMIINGLRPYMEVVTVGTTTYGKNVGSKTIYDSKDFSKDNPNINHTNAMQPITFRVFNKLDQGDYTMGFEPDYEEIEYALDIKAFGNLSEPLLRRTLSVINGAVAKRSHKIKTEMDAGPIFSSIDQRKFSKEMYILPNKSNANR